MVSVLSRLHFIRRCYPSSLGESCRAELRRRRQNYSDQPLSRLIDKTELAFKRVPTGALFLLAGAFCTVSWCILRSFCCFSSLLFSSLLFLSLPLPSLPIISALF